MITTIKVALHRYRRARKEYMPLPLNSIDAMYDSICDTVNVEFPDVCHTKRKSHDAYGFSDPSVTESLLRENRLFNESAIVWKKDLSDIEHS